MANLNSLPLPQDQFKKKLVSLQEATSQLVQEASYMFSLTEQELSLACGDPMQVWSKVPSLSLNQFLKLWDAHCRIEAKKLFIKKWEPLIGTTVKNFSASVVIESLHISVHTGLESGYLVVYEPASKQKWVANPKYIQFN